MHVAVVVPYFVYTFKLCKQEVDCKMSTRYVNNYK